MRNVVLIFVGGGLGSVVRHYISKWINGLGAFSFPMGTLAANLLACLILGIIIGFADHKYVMPPATRLFWTVGFCGGFSTFSAFSNETLTLLQGGFTLTAALYVGASLLLCVFAVYAGLYLGQQL